MARTGQAGTPGSEDKAASSKGKVKEGASGRTLATRKVRNDADDATMDDGGAAPTARKSDEGRHQPVPRSGTGVKHPGSNSKSRAPDFKPTDTAPTETTPRAGPGSAPPARHRQGSSQ